MQQIKTEKPWGYEILWAKTDKYVGKIIKINNGKRLSLQYHNKKSETICVLDGVLELHIKDNISDKINTFYLKKGDSYDILVGTIHRFCCPEDSWGVELVEVSTPELDDVVRVEDDFGRV